MTRAAALLASLCAGAAAAQTFAPFKMVHAPYPIYIDGNFSAAGPVANVEQDVQAAINAWNGAPGSYARWAYAGRATPPGFPTGMAATEDVNDTFSVAALFVTQASDPYYNYALGAQAISAAVPLTYAGQLYACDIFLNAKDFTWVSGGTPVISTTASVQTFVSHELGRCMGLTDLPNDLNAIMWDQTLGTKKLPIQADFDLAKTGYPNDGSAVGSPCDGQQGAPTTCQGTLRCAAPAGNDPWGRPWRKMCTQQCTPTGMGACPIPYACVSSNVFVTNGFACLPNTGNDITQVGRDCTQATIARCQSPVAVCNAQGQLPSGGAEWYQGYCTQNCAAAGGTPCPNGSECVQTRTGTYQCLKSCRTGYADCRLSYACAALPGVRDGVCISACAGDVDCNGTSPFCRTCDGLCFNQNKPTGVIGDTCTSNADCGAAQVCYTGFTWTTTGKGVCTQPCGNVCSACPNGSTCVALPYSGGSLLCMRDCLPGTCAPGQQCLSIGGSRACVPSCTATSCPPGQTCQQGQCLPSNADGGTCDLCYAGGSGGGTLPDGGTGPGNPDTGGCGCQSAGATGAAILFALAFLFTRRARQSWPRP
jgi:uncharacterized protein (TIGR03382 family)